MARPTVRGGVTAAVIAASLSLLFGVHEPIARQTYNADRAYEIPATQDVKYRVADRPPHDLIVVLHYIHTWLSRPAHRGEGYVIREIPGMEWSRKRNLHSTLHKLRERLQKAEVDDYFGIMSVHSRFHMWILKVDVNPAKIIDTEGTQAVDIIVGTTVTKFPNIASAGIYVCRYISGSYSLSQHSYANAVDWIGSRELLASVAAYQLRLRRLGYLPASQILWNGRDTISGHSVYDHYDHVHDSGSPLLSGSCRRPG